MSAGGKRAESEAGIAPSTAKEGNRHPDEGYSDTLNPNDDGEVSVKGSQLQRRPHGGNMQRLQISSYRFGNAVKQLLRPCSRKSSESRVPLDT